MCKQCCASCLFVFSCRNKEVGKLKRPQIKTNLGWRTKEETTFLRSFFPNSEVPLNIGESQRPALYLEILFLSDRLHVDHLCYGLKERGFSILPKYLQRILDLGVILGCLDKKKK